MNSEDIEDDDGLERLFERIRPDVPRDAADRVLSVLGPAEIKRLLWRADLERSGGRAVRWSAVGVLLGIAALAGSVQFGRSDGHASLYRLHAASHRLRTAPGSDTSPAALEATQLADPFTSTRGDERLLLDPFLFAMK